MGAGYWGQIYFPFGRIPSEGKIDLSPLTRPHYPFLFWPVTAMVTPRAMNRLPEK